MAAEASAAQKTSERGGRGLFMGNEKGRDVRSTNILAARAVSNMVRTSLGPKGMDKMIVSSNNDVVITNDGATILNKMEVLHPAAKMLVDISKAQDVEAGDGTTSVVVIAGGLMEAAQSLLDKGVHPSTISDAFLLAQRQSVEILRSIAIPCDLKNREGLLQIASTSLNSKVVSTHSDLLAPLAVDAVLRIINPDVDRSVDLSNIRLFKKLGGTIEDTELVDGLVFDTPVSHSAGGPVRIENAKIGLIQFCLSAPKTNMENTVIVDDYQSIDRILREERAYITELIKPIVKSGCNVLLIQKSILRDAVNDLSLSFLAKKKIMVIKDIERSDIEFICETLGCTPIADAKSFDAKKLGQAKLVEEQNSASGKFVKVTGVNNPGKTVSVLVRGSNRLICDEAERSLHDALCVVRCLVKERFLIPGGACPEVELAQQLAAFAEQQGGMAGYCIREYARSLEVIPYTLAENAGLNPIAIVSELRKQHAEGKRTVGINVRKGKISDMLEEQVVQPLLVTTSALNLATEVCRMLLKIDDVVAVRG